MSAKRKLKQALRIVFPDEGFISTLNWEIKLTLIHLCARLSPLERKKIRSLNRRTDLKINIGNGPIKRKDWINVDCQLSSDKDSLAFDVRRPWPFATGIADMVFSEHVFEHFSFPDEIQHILRECNRVLKKNGILRIIVPDAGRYLKAYYERDEAFLSSVSRDIKTNMQAVNRVFRENGFHKYAYDFETLRSLLEEAGFTCVQQSSFRNSRLEDLNIDVDEPERRLESLYVEAVR